MYTQESPIDSSKDWVTARESRKDGRNRRRSDLSGETVIDDGSRAGKRRVTRREGVAREPHAQAFPASELVDRPAAVRRFFWCRR